MEIVIILFLIVLNGVFSMSEIALISARKSRLETAAKKGNPAAKVALDLANSPNKFLSTVQIGITLIGILTGIYSGDKITTDVQDFVAGFEVLKPYANSIAVGIVVVVLTFFSLVLGELVSLTELGLFAAGYTLAIQVVAAVELILNTWFQPVFYKDCDSESSAVQSSAWSKYACNIWLPAALAVSALVSGAPFFVRFMLGDGYQNTVHYVQLGALVEFGRILVGVGGLYFHQHKQTNKLILPSAAGAVVALLLVLLWVPQYGVSSTLPALFVGCLLSFGWLLFLIPKSSRPSLRAWMNLLKGVLLALFLLIICMVFQIQLADYWLWVWTVLWTVVGVIYLKMRIQ